MECLESSPRCDVANALIMQQTLAVINTMYFMTPWNTNRTSPEDGDCFDYIVVGGGTSGCVIANRLSEDSAFKVLLIEAGGDIPLESALASLLLYVKGSQHEWNYKLANGRISGHEENNFITLAGKVLGGTSAIDLMVRSPNFDRDYDEWADITKEKSWRFENMQRLLKKVERLQDPFIANSSDKIYHGFDGKVRLVKDYSPTLDTCYKILEEAGHRILPDINNKKKLGFTGTIFYRDHVRQSSSLAYLYPAKDRPNLFVVKKTQVTKLIIDSNKKVVGVEAVATKTNKVYTFKANLEVILAAGAFNTPKILQLSGIGPQNLLHSLNITNLVDLPVGCNYQNHISLPVAVSLNKTSTLFKSMRFDSNKFPDRSFEGFVTLNKSEEYPDYRVLGFRAPYTPPTVMTRYASIFFRYDPDVVEYWQNHINGREEFIAFIDDTKPKSRGKVCIQSQNPFDEPIIYGEHFSKEIDLKNAARYIKDFLKIENSPYFKEIGAFFVDPMKGKCGVYNRECDEYWMCYARHMMFPNSHQCGTAAMGSVVDGRLRVYGVQGLRVADASVMPTITSGSTTIPTFAIAENAAEMIKHDRRSKILCEKFHICRNK